MKRMLNGLFATGVFVAGLLASEPLLLAGGKNAVQLFFTGDVYGYLKPCG
ncbi:MAG: hypothetical protein ACE5IY_18035 [bacterium]